MRGASSEQFPVEPWAIREIGCDLAGLARSESLFALSNGHVGVRGNFDEGEPNGVPGTYLNGFHETYPIAYGEQSYGNPESGQTVVNVTNGKLLRLLVNDEPLDLRYGWVRHHERVLDFRAGTLERRVEWRSPAGQNIRVRSVRLVSLTQRATMAIRYEVEPVGSPARLVVQSELVADEPLERAGASIDGATGQQLEPVDHGFHGHRSSLLHRTRRSGLLLAAAADHVIEGEDVLVNTIVSENWARTSIAAHLAVGQRLTVTKFVTYGWSSRRSLAAMRDQVDAALSGALHTGWDELCEEQRGYLDEFWDCADVELDGDPAVQQAIRFSLFHLLQASARAEQRAIPAKGLTGTGYSGHSFWDAETFVLPVLVATTPGAAADALRWRHSTLDLAQKRATTLHLAGAAFPWRTIHGEECSAYWPAGTAAFHVSADIAVAADRYVEWTADEEFDRDHALPILVETARLWLSIGHFGADGKFHIDGVTGPDEYSAIADDNTYTNLVAAHNLLGAARAARQWSDAAAARNVTAKEISDWERAANHVAVPYVPDGSMPEQDRGWTRHERWDFAASARDDAYPLYKHYHYFNIYRKQVVKQADLVLALQWYGDRFSAEEKAKAFAYYEELTVRDSSLSASVQAVVAAEVGQLELAYDYLLEAALIDLRDREHNVADGLHMAALAGSWFAAVGGFGGLRSSGGMLCFAPRLPSEINRLCFGVRWRSWKVRVTVTADIAHYAVAGGPDEPLELRHHGETLRVAADSPAERPIPPLPEVGERPRQPVGREPLSSAGKESGEEAGRV